MKVLVHAQITRNHLRLKFVNKCLEISIIWLDIFGILDISTAARPHLTINVASFIEIIILRDPYHSSSANFPTVSTLQLNERLIAYTSLLYS